MKKVKVINIDADKCNGCRACEVICSAFHASPRYSSTNPEKSRIRVLFDPLKNIYLPVLAGEHTEAECNGRYTYIINGKKYDDCAFCRATCPSRTLFKDPDSDLPLKCDMCEEDPSLPEPLCVKWCIADSLTYEQKEVEGEEEEKPGELEIQLESLVEKHGGKRVMDILARFARK